VVIPVSLGSATLSVRYERDSLRTPIDMHVPTDIHSDARRGVALLAIVSALVVALAIGQTAQAAEPAATEPATAPVAEPAEATTPVEPQDTQATDPSAAAALQSETPAEAAVGTAAPGPEELVRIDAPPVVEIADPEATTSPDPPAAAAVAPSTAPEAPPNAAPQLSAARSAARPDAVPDAPAATAVTGGLAGPEAPPDPAPAPKRAPMTSPDALLSQNAAPWSPARSEQAPAASAVTTRFAPQEILPEPVELISAPSPAGGLLQFLVAYIAPGDADHGAALAPLIQLLFVLVGWLLLRPRPVPEPMSARRTDARGGYRAVVFRPG
jgi:hypothetical protein